MAVELTVIIMCRDEDQAAEVLEVLNDEYDVVESEMEEV
jgi:hypothetical protein